MRPAALKYPFLLLALVPGAVHAQAAPDRVEAVACDSGHDDRDRYCEIREYTLPALSSISVDAGPNGGIRVEGWDRDEIRLRARVGARDRRDDPRDLAREIRIMTGEVIRADGPPMRGSGRGWWVSYDLMVPRATALRLAARNGGIALERLAGDVDARTTNGGLTVVGGSGRIHGETVNGGVRVELTGDAWQGEGVDLRTTNGGVRIAVPDGYSAELETGTVNGSMRLDFPVTVQGRVHRRIRTELGNGGPLIRAITTNGGVTVTRG